MSLRLFMNRTLALGVVACGLLWAPAAQSMTVLKAPLKSLVGTSTLVLHGKVAETKVLDKRKQGLAIFTRVTLHILEVYKGDRAKLGAQFSWEMVGGTGADGMTWSVPGMPTFRKGEEVVVLLEKHARGYTLTGAPQGKYVVFRDAKGVPRVHRNLGDVHMMRRGANGRLTEVKHQSQLLLPPRLDPTLGALRAEIRGYVRLGAKLMRGKLKARQAVGKRP